MKKTIPLKKAEAKHFSVHGGKKLTGTIETNSSKNGAVVMLCASLLNNGTTTLTHVPKIEEVYRLLEVLESIGVTTSWSGSTLTLTPPKKLSLRTLDKEAGQKTRSLLMFIGPLLHHFSSFSIPQSGGCKLGSRTVQPHFFALENLGVSIETTEDAHKVHHTGLHGADFVMYESGDTATENAIMAAARIPATTTIRYASANYMVQDLCSFLELFGVRFEGVGTTTLTIHGVADMHKDVTYAISEDPTDAMFFLAASIVTKSSITITRAPIRFLELELLKLKKMGFSYTIKKQYKGRNGEIDLVDIVTKTSVLTALDEKIYSRPYPGLNMDNLPFFAVIATQAHGHTLIHDWTYEKRAIYYTELDKLGANTTLMDPHRMLIQGPSTLRPAELICPPALRPATILLIAMLGAKGHSILRNVYSINRGYEDLVTRLRSLGADISLLHE